MSGISGIKKTGIRRDVFSGMSRKEAFGNLLFENVIISVLALAIALAAGTVLSFLFFPLSFMQ